jgi:HEAT repeat protein
MDSRVSRPAAAILTIATCCVAALAAGSSVSCTAPRPPVSIQNEDTDIKVLAIKKAVREKDKSAIPKLVEELSSDDPAVRFYAIEALEELTGQTLDYKYYQDDEGRKEAVEKWKKWVGERGK